MFLFVLSFQTIHSFPIILIPIWIEFGILDILRKLGSLKLCKTHLVLPVVTSNTVSVMGNVLNQNFQANHEPKEVSPGKT